jgi:hypothetical protein
MTIQTYVWILYGRSMGGWKVPCKLGKPPAVPGGSGKLSTVTFLFVSYHPGGEVLTAGYAGAEWPNTNDSAYYYYSWLVSTVAPR